VSAKASPAEIGIDEARRRSRKGPLLLLMRRALMLLITLLSTVTVARLVAPREYGLANMATVILAFGQVFRDFGMTNAVMRKEQIDRDELSFIFWFNVAATLLISAIIVVSAPAISDFYNEPAVLWVIEFSVIGFVASGVALQHVALLNREFRFGVVAAVDIFALLIGFITTLTLAFIRHDVWAIVTGTVVQSVVGSGLFLFISKWRPDRPKRPENLGDLLKFGANTSIFSISVFLSGNVSVVAIGHYLGSALLGQFNRAQTLFALPSTNLVQPISQATIPLLRRLRSQPEEYRATYVGLVRNLCAILTPAAVILAFGGPSIAIWLLGPKWVIAGKILAALAPALAGVGLGYAIADLFITQDRSAEMRTLGLFEMVIRVGAVLFGVQFGVIGVAIAFSTATLAVVLLRLVVAGRRGPVTAADQLRAVIPSIPLFLGALVGCVAVMLLTRDKALSATILSLIYIAAGSAGTVAVGSCFAGSRQSLLDLARVFGVARAAGALTKRFRPKSAA
jgi:PST family polysaccharide transporter